MGTLTTQETIRAGATVYLGAAGAAIGGAFTPIGYTTEKITVDVTKEEHKLVVGQYAGPVENDQEIIAMGVKGSTIQVGAEQVCAALGVTQNGNTITLGGSAPNAIRKFAVKIVGPVRRDGMQMVVWMPNAISKVAVTFDFARTDFTQIPLEFESTDGASGMGQIVFGSGNVTKTIASGLFTRDAAVAYYLLAGEGAAADALMGISGTFTDGEEVVLAISSATMPITLTHTASGTGVLNLDGAANWIMDSVNDWIRLRYNLSLTKFVEVARYNVG